MIFYQSLLFAMCVMPFYSNYIHRFGQFTEKVKEYISLYLPLCSQCTLSILSKNIRNSSFLIFSGGRERVPWGKKWIKSQTNQRLMFCYFVKNKEKNSKIPVNGKATSLLLHSPFCTALLVMREAGVSLLCTPRSFVFKSNQGY